jgi:hypothetical protein
MGIPVTLLSSEEEAPEGSIVIHHGLPGGSLHFPFSGILQETGSHSYRCQLALNWKESTLRIKSSETVSGDLPGLVFWLLSRYEEHDPEIPKDQHGRFPTQANELVKTNLEKIPLVDKWAAEIKEILKTLEVPVKSPETETTLSFDLDNLSAYRHKGLLRTGAATIRDLASGKIKNIQERASVLLGKAPDPYENTNEILKILKETNSNSRFFVWIGDYGLHDKGLDYRSTFFRSEIQRIAMEHSVALHPSYGSFGSLDQLKKEKDRLENILKAPITSCRFHYLRFSPADSYPQLEELGFTSDYSMGFSEIAGFRAGTSFPFQWYDFRNERTSGLTLYPFMNMDSGSRFIRNESKEKFLEDIESMLISIKTYGGRCEPLFHNEFPSWKGWNEVLKEYLDLINRYSRP